MSKHDDDDNESMFSNNELREKKQYLAVESLNVDANLSSTNSQRLIQELRAHQIELVMQNDELRCTQNNFERALEKYHTLFNLAPMGYMTCDLKGFILEINKTMCDMLGLEKNQLVSTPLSRFSTLEHQDTYYLYIQELLEHDDKQTCDLELSRSDGTTITTHIVSTKERDEDGTWLIRSAVIDNTELTFQNKEKEKRADELGLANIELAFQNKEKDKRADELILANEEKEKRADELGLANEEKEKRADELGLANIELAFQNKEKDKRADELILANIEKEKRADELGLAITELEQIAHYDILTNLPNRSLLADRLSQAMLQCSRSQQLLAVAYMDLDGFKAVNDTYGHDVGDQLLVTLSQRMRAALREGDTLARIGGDEFIVVMVNVDNTEDEKPVLERLLKAAAEPFNVGDAVMQVSASIGVTLYPQDDVDADQLIRHADQAMYIAKQAGKNRYHLFDTAQDNAINIQLESISDICSALEQREFVLHYQPKVNMHTGEVIGVEALIRWQHPDRGLIPPLEFLPVIEGHAISLELGEWVIETALSQISQWQIMGVTLLFSVNISAYQLQQRNFTTRLTALLAAHPDVNPHYLELEILETSALHDISQVSATMNVCHELGVRFALDDFGTGYSSLTYLRRLPAYLIKIDQSFVRDMLEDADDLAIVEGVIGLAKSFQRKVIAEGVESIEHGTALLQLGCELAQGYGIARPMPAGEIPAWVGGWKPDDAWQV